MGETPGALSPNQVARRQQIITAARRIILRSGPAHCTTRVVAKESGLAQGLIHYYFSSVEEIVDAAILELAEEFITMVQASRQTGQDSAANYRALILNFLRFFHERPGLNMATLEYWLLSTRAHRTEHLAALEDRVLGVLTGSLAATGAKDPHALARVAGSYVLGVLVRSWANPDSVRDLDAEIDSIIAGTSGT